MPPFDAWFDLDALDAALRAPFEAAGVDDDAPWTLLAGLDAVLADRIAADLAAGAAEPGADATRARVHPTALLEGDVAIHPDAEIGPYAWVQGPAWIGPGARVGHAAVVRGGAMLGAGTNVGHASEVKRSLLLPGAKAPHFAYVGDAVLGRDVNLGAGVKIANLKHDGGNVAVDGVDTGLRKFGAILGDRVAVGCNAVLGPGAIVGAGSRIYAGAVVAGRVPGGVIVKHRPPLETAALR
ncbi:MAG: hypothetical protein RI554_05720 [Trueperaceae bacterium]|nr:hypothetical protein [Trueperaceae bacterium]